MYEIIIGREEEDRQKFGLEGAFLLGKHYVMMGHTTSLSTPVFMDVLRPHVVFICGKRGSGKSYSLAAMIEGMFSLPASTKKNLSAVIIDTMGIFWTMKYENKRDRKLIDKWGLNFQKLNTKTYVPMGQFEEMEKQGMADACFSIRPSELSATEWCMTFSTPVDSPVGVIISRAVNEVKKHKKEYSVKDLISEIRDDLKAEQHVKDAAENHFAVADSWGLFSEKGSSFREFDIGGQITIIDVSRYASLTGSKSIRALVIGLICQKIFAQKMSTRKQEELGEIKTSGLLAEQPKKEKKPITWVFVDEAHEFLPKTGETTATKALLTLLREGRQPGISLVLASQQPGQIHTDVITQADSVLAHRITAKIDIEALGELMQSYMRETLDKAINDLPRVKGAALIFDDINERIYSIQVRPRITWHGGESPTTMQKKDVF